MLPFVFHPSTALVLRNDRGGEAQSPQKLLYSSVSTLQFTWGVAGLRRRGEWRVRAPPCLPLCLLPCTRLQQE